jgi:ribosomal protein L37E
MTNRNEVSRRAFLDATGKAAVALPCGIICGRALAAEPAAKDGKIEYKVVAPCGIYCGACEGLIKSVYSKDPKNEGCHGCLSDKVPDWSCNKCTVRACAMEKKLESCAFCTAYPDCPKLKQVLTWAKTEQDLKTVKEKGLEEYKKEQKAKFSCRKCGSAFSNKDKKCRKCGEPTMPS